MERLLHHRRVQTSKLGFNLQYIPDTYVAT